MASSTQSNTILVVEPASSISAPSLVKGTPATKTVLKTIVFTPDDIQKIGLGNVIKTEGSTNDEGQSSVENEDSVDTVGSEDVEATLNVVKGEVGDDTDDSKMSADETLEAETDVKVSPNTSNTFCKNLQAKMQQVLQEKKITIVAKKKEQELVIIKKPTGMETVDGRRVKVAQNQIVQIPKPSVDIVNGKVTKIVVKASPKLVARKSTFDYDEDMSPVFKATPMKTYKRKRSEGEEVVVKKPVFEPNIKKVEETVKQMEDKADERKQFVNFASLHPKKRGRKSNAERAAMIAARIKQQQDTFDIGEENDEEEPEHEEIFIVHVPEEKDEDDDDEVEEEEEEEEFDDQEEIHFITDQDDGEDSSKPVSTFAKKYARMSSADIYKAIRSKRGRKSKEELEFLDMYENKDGRSLKKKPRKEEVSEDEEIEEDEDDEEVDEEAEQMMLSPTRTGRVPKRNKLFDVYITSSRSVRKSSASDTETPKEKKTPVIQKVSDGETVAPKRGRGRPPKNRNVETSKVIPAKVLKEEEVKIVTKNDKSEAVHVTGDDEVIVIPKKRGRPAVSKVADVERNAEKAEELADVEMKEESKSFVEEAANPEGKKDDNKNDEDDEQTKCDKTEKTGDSDDVKLEVKESEENETNKESESKNEDGHESNDDNADEDGQEEGNEDAGSEDDQQNNESNDDAGDGNKDKEGEDSSKDDQNDEDKNEDNDEEEGAKDAKDDDPEIKTSDEKAKKDSKEAEVVTVRRRGRQASKTIDEPKVNNRSRKRKMQEREESPSTSAAAADGVDEPSKRRNVESSNEPVADLGATPKEESATQKMYRLLVTNLVVNVRERMAAAVDQPKGPGQTVTCAVCKVNCKPNEWKTHKVRWHNNIAWATTEPAWDLDNIQWVTQNLNKLYPSKPYHCDLCNDSKKSAIGFLTHKVLCNKTLEQVEALKTDCKLCDAMILPQQIVEHEKYHKKVAQKLEKAAVLKPTEPLPNEDGTPRKRNAARKATEMIMQVSKELSMNDDSELNIPYKLLKQFYIKNSCNSISVRNLIKNAIESGPMKCIFACDTEFTEMKALYEHFGNCPNKPSPFFVCKLCLAVHIAIGAFRKHVADSHKDEVERKSNDADVFNLDETHIEIDPEEYEDDDFDDASSTKSKRETTVNCNAFWKLNKFVRMNFFTQIANERPGNVNYLVYIKMLQFCSKYYSKQLFFEYPFKRSVWYNINKNYIAQYLPGIKQSIKIGIQSKTSEKVSDIKYKKYKLFESEINSGVANVFCGGPISALAWAPVDYEQTECEQLLAIAAQKSPSRQYSLKKRYSHKNVIQLWNFGVLLNEESIVDAPKLEVLIAHQYGQVFAMEWCPSGCYEENGLRLGLLAVCCSDGNVYCYSIGKSNSLNDKICKPKPIFRLTLSNHCDINCGYREFYPIRLSWSKSSGHKYIAVAYSNGIVGMFNIKSQSELLREVDLNNIDLIYPYMCFKADNQEITAISLNYLDGGNRYLLTGSLTRQFKLWDLNFFISKQFGKRACVNQIFWPTNSLSCFNASDDSSSSGNLNITTTHIVDFEYPRPGTFIYSHAGQRSITGSDWGGPVYVGNEAGEVAYGTYRDLHPFQPELSSKRYLCSNTSVVVDGDNELSAKDRSNYRIIQKTHKLLFHDYNLNSKAHLREQDRNAHQHSIQDITTFPIQAATATCTNPNRFSFLFTAVGYNIGLVRVFHSKYMNAV